MTQRRTLRPGSTGEDVMEAKQRLFSLGCYAEHVAAVTTDVYGADTHDAVKSFQRSNGLTADGIIGTMTWVALFPEEHSIPTALNRGQIPQQIGDAAAGAILNALESQSETRRGIVLDALQYAYDADMASKYPISLYIRGGNLYNTDLTPNVITLKRIATGAKRQP